MYILIILSLFYYAFKYRKNFMLHLIIFISYIFYICANNQGYNGYSPLNRLLTPILPLTILPFAKLLEDFDTTNLFKYKILRIICFLLIAVSIIFTLIFSIAPILRYPNHFQYNSFLWLIKR